MEDKVLSYAAGREKIKDGDVVFVRGGTGQSQIKALGQKIIMFFTRSEYCHVGIAFWATINGKKRLMIAEASGLSNRRIVNLSFYSEYAIDVVTPVKSWSEIADEALSQVGVVGYGYIDAIWIGLREYFHKLNIKHKDFGGEVCSEYVAKMQKLDKTVISPQRLFDKLIEKGQKIRVKVSMK